MNSYMIHNIITSIEIHITIIDIIDIHLPPTRDARIATVLNIFKLLN
jgi:hypothetical protein